MKFYNVYNVTTLPGYSIVYDVHYHDGNEHKKVNKKGETITRENAEKVTGIVSNTHSRIDGLNDCKKDYNPIKPKMQIGAYSYRLLTRDMEDMVIVNVSNAEFGNFQDKKGIHLDVEGKNEEFAKKTLLDGKRIGMKAVAEDNALVLDLIFAIVEFEDFTIYMGKRGNYSSKKS